MKKDENSYRNILKGTSIFGGVQIFNILINLVRGKFVALLLGPAGMGVSSLYTTAVNTLHQATGLGLNMALVPETSAARDNPELLGSRVATARRLMLIIALGGALLTLLLSPLLSRLTFGNADHTFGFMALSLAVFLLIYGGGQLALLQGLHVVKRLSKASLVGALTGLLAGVPLYWLFGTGGIVPAIILLALAMAVFYEISLHKALRGIPVSFGGWRSQWPVMRSIVAMGIVLTVAGVLTTGATYLLNLVIRYYGSVADIGLFQAANTITMQYVGMVFTAMALDYFPRLSALTNDNRAMTEAVCRQTDIVMQLMAPLTLLMIIFAPLCIRILLSDEFLTVTPLMRWLALAMMFKGVSYPMGYIALAKENKRVYFWVEAIFCNTTLLLLSIGGYLLGGLEGLAIGTALCNLLDIAVYYIVNRRLYGFRYSRRTLRQIAIALTATGAGFAALLLPDPLTGYIAAGAVTLASIIYSLTAMRNSVRREAR